MCLHCGAILCGRYVNQHALQHSQKPNHSDHCVCLNTLNQSVFCYSCDDFVLNDTADRLIDSLRACFTTPDDAPPSPVPVAAARSSPAANNSASASASASLKPPAKSSSTVSSASSTCSSQETRSTSSSDSGLGVEETVTPPAAPSPSGVAVGRKLRPRKRTISSDSSDTTTAAKRKSTLLRKVVGLRNLGNTCFMNSVLQSLSNIQEFSCYFNALPSLDATAGANTPAGKHTKRVYQSRSLKENCNSGSSSDANVVEELRKILTNLSHGGDGSKAISPECLFLVIWKVVPQFRGHRQHDAHEFLRYMLDRLHTELQNVATPLIVDGGKGGAAGATASSSTIGGGGGGGKLQLGPATSGLDASSIMFKGRSSIVTSTFGGTLQSEVSFFFSDFSEGENVLSSAPWFRFVALFAAWRARNMTHSSIFRWTFPKSSTKNLPRATRTTEAANNRRATLPIVCPVSQR